MEKIFYQKISYILFSLIVLCIGIFMPLKNVAADTFGFGPYGDIATVNRNKSIYAPGEAIEVTGSINPVSASEFLSISVSTSGNSQVSLSGASNGAVTFTAPSTPGSYSLNFIVGVVLAYLNLECQSFANHCYGNFRNVDTSQLYNLQGGDSGTSLYVPPGTYEWQGGNVPNPSQCPIYEEMVQTEIGTQMTIGAAPNPTYFTGIVECH